MENSQKLFKQDTKAGERQCYEIDWISFRAFKDYVDDCWDVGCEITGHINNIDQLVGLKVSAASLEDLLKYKKELELNTLNEVIERVANSIATNDNIDNSTWGNVVSEYWKNP